MAQIGHFPVFHILICGCIEQVNQVNTVGASTSVSTLVSHTLHPQTSVARKSTEVNTFLMIPFVQQCLSVFFRFQFKGQFCHNTFFGKLELQGKIDHAADEIQQPFVLRHLYRLAWVIMVPMNGTIDDVPL